MLVLTLDQHESSISVKNDVHVADSKIKHHLNLTNDVPKAHGGLSILLNDSFGSSTIRGKKLAKCG